MGGTTLLEGMSRWPAEARTLGGVKTGLLWRGGVLGPDVVCTCAQCTRIDMGDGPEVLHYLIVRDAPRHQTNCFSPHLDMLM